MGEMGYQCLGASQIAISVVMSFTAHQDEKILCRVVGSPAFPHETVPSFIYSVSTYAEVVTMFEVLFRLRFPSKK